MRRLILHCRLAGAKDMNNMLLFWYSLRFSWKYDTISFERCFIRNCWIFAGKDTISDTNLCIANYAYVWLASLWGIKGIDVRCLPLKVQLIIKCDTDKLCLAYYIKNYGRFTKCPPDRVQYTLDRVILDRADPFSKCICRNICDLCLTREWILRICSRSRVRVEIYDWK